MKKLLVAQSIFLGILAFVLIGALAVGLFGGFMGFSDNYSNFNISDKKITNTQTFSAKDIDKITLDYVREKIVLVPSKDGQITVQEHLASDKPAKQSEIINTNGALHVKSRERNWLNWFSFSFSKTPYVVLYLPENFSGDISMETTSGGIVSEYAWLNLNSFSANVVSGGVKLDAITAKTSIDIESTSGGIKLNGDITCTGNISLSALSGSIKAQNINCKTLQMDSTSGGIKVAGAIKAGTAKIESLSGGIIISNLSGKVNLSSTSGGLKIASFSGSGIIECLSGGMKIGLQELTGDLKLESTSGGVKVELLQNLSFYFEAETTSGGINTSFDDELNYSRSEHSASGNVGSNPKYTITCSALSGGIKIN